MHHPSESSYKAISSSTFDRPLTALVLVDGVLASFQTFPSVNVNSNCAMGPATKQQNALNGAAPVSRCNRADNCWMEPLPFEEEQGSVNHEASSIESNRQTLHDTSNLINLASYTANLDDPYAPRPMLETADESMAFVDEAEGTEQRAFSVDTQDDDEDEAERYFEIADILNDDFGEQSSHSNKRPRTSQHDELDIFEEGERTTTMPSNENTFDATHSEAFQDEVKSTSIESTTKTEAYDESKAMDAASIAARLDHLMFQSELTQSALQYFDKRRGLPKSHCPSMVNSSRSRKQLLEGKIIKKWNGCPLLSGGEDSSDTLSVKSDPGPPRKRRRKQNTRTPLTSVSIDSNLLFEKILSKNGDDSTRQHEKPQRRMSF